MISTRFNRFDATLQKPKTPNIHATRAKEVQRMVKLGMTQEEIADALGVSKNAVKRMAALYQPTRNRS